MKTRHKDLFTLFFVKIIDFPSRINSIFWSSFLSQKKLYCFIELIYFTYLLLPRWHPHFSLSIKTRSCMLSGY